MTSVQIRPSGHGAHGALLLVVTAVAAAFAVRGAMSGRDTRSTVNVHAHPTSARASSTAPATSLDRIISDDAPLPVTSMAAADVQPAPSSPATRVVAGPMEDLLYGAGPSGRDTAVVVQAMSLFAHKLDLTRDVALGDRIRLVVRRGRAGRGEVLDYAEWRGGGGRALRIYRRDESDGFAAADFADDTGEGLSHLLLRTPLASRRVTSGFGFRWHPLLGYSRLHAGVDFAAEVGTPVLAAGDGVVSAARWAGGYGRLVQLDHGAGLQTRYAHLSAWPADLRAGVRVRQGQVIGWTGASGLATGPHLHFEVRQDGRPIDPKLVGDLPSPPQDLVRRLAFQSRKQAIDAVLGDAP